MKLASRVIGSLSALGLLLGCTAMTASSASLQGDWVLKEIRGSQPLLLADADGPFTLSLDENNRAGGKVACNGWHGQARNEAGILQLQSAGSTRMRCIIKDAAIRALEKRYLLTLQTPATPTVTGDQLQLQFGSGETWVFLRNQP